MARSKYRFKTRAEYEEALKKLEENQHQIENIPEIEAAIESEVAAVVGECQEALEFYADASKWYGPRSGVSPIHEDFGKKARSTLAKLKKAREAVKTRSSLTRRSRK